MTHFLSFYTCACISVKFSIAISTRSKISKSSKWYVPKNTTSTNGGLSVLKTLSLSKKTNGPIKSSGEVLNSVKDLKPSISRPGLLKAFFNGRYEPLLVNLSLFDYNANELSLPFKELVKKSMSFCSKFQCLIEKTTQSPQPDKTVTQSSTEFEIQDISLNSLNSDVEISRPPTDCSTPALNQPQVDLRPQSPGVSEEGLRVVNGKKRKAKEKKRKKHQKKSKADDDCLSDADFQSYVSREYSIGGNQSFRVLTATLKEPRRSFKLRELEERHVKDVKEELIKRPVSYGKTVIGIIRGLKDKTQFKDSALDSYDIEVIGGNHRRVAKQQLLQNPEYASNEDYKYTDIQLFTESPAVASVLAGHNCVVINNTKTNATKN